MAESKCGIGKCPEEGEYYLGKYRVRVCLKHWAADKNPEHLKDARSILSRWQPMYRRLTGKNPYDTQHHRNYCEEFGYSDEYLREFGDLEGYEYSVAFWRTPPLVKIGWARTTEGVAEQVFDAIVDHEKDLGWELTSVSLGGRIAESYDFVRLADYVTNVGVDLYKFEASEQTLTKHSRADLVDEVNDILKREYPDLFPERVSTA